MAQSSRRVSLVRATGCPDPFTHSVLFIPPAGITSGASIAPIRAL